MSGATISLHQADENTLSYLTALLEENDLPSQDVQSKPECFFVGYDSDKRIGVGGIERYGTDGLLRSVVIELSDRGNGLGAALVEQLERVAKEDGVNTLYLLTTTASEFFNNRGYDEIERSDVPSSIQQTTEFTDFCPSSATCMEKTL